MRRFLIPAVSLAALTMGGFAIAQDSTTAPAPEQPAQVQPDPNTTTPPADTGAAPAAPDANTTAQDPAAAPEPPATTAQDPAVAPTPDTGTAATGTDTTTTTTTDTAATGATGPGFLATSVIGKSVYTSAKENIGDINDLMVGEKGEVTAAIIGIGGFLGMGEKDVAVPLDKLSMSKDENGMEYLTITASREELEAAPAFDRTMVTGSLQ